MENAKVICPLKQGDFPSICESCTFKFIVDNKLSGCTIRRRVTEMLNLNNEATKIKEEIINGNR